MQLWCSPISLSSNEHSFFQSKYYPAMQVVWPFMQLSIIHSFNKYFWSNNCVSDCSAAAAAKSLQSCLTLCDPIDSSPPGSSAPGILQARILEWVAISFSNAWRWKVKVKSLSPVQLWATPWTAAYRAPPSMGFSRQEYWSGVPSPSPQIVLGAHNIVVTNSETQSLIKHMTKRQAKITVINNLV